MCRIYDAYKNDDDSNHICLGCNFDELTAHIRDFLTAVGAGNVQFSLEHSYCHFSLMVNMLWERITDVFDMLSVPEGYRCRHFESFIRMRRWANFFKHPKEFGWLVHHPRYFFTGSVEAVEACAPGSAYKIIDDAFVKKYFSADRCKGLASEFTGVEDRVVVLLPEVGQVAAEIGDCLTKFVEVVTSNSVYKEILSDRSVISGYFDRDHGDLPHATD
jgi:hypothetical protein